MLYEITNRFPNEMIFEEGEPLISLYQPTHRSFPENKQDHILYKNLLREIEKSLNKKFEKNFSESIMKPLYELEKDRVFWGNTQDGIAVLVSENKCIVYNLHDSIKEFVMVANSFHIKPLIKAFQFVENYHLLGLSRNNFTLYQGNRYGFSEVELAPETPRTLEEVLGKQLTEPYLGQGSFGGTGGRAMYHGHGDVKQEIDKDTDKYFRYVDHFVLENYSNHSNLPLILVSLKEYHSHFRKISNNPYILEAGINSSYDSLEINEIKNKALEIIEPLNLRKISSLVESYKTAEAQSLGSSDLVQVSKAAFDSRVETLCIEENRIVPGKIDNNTGKLVYGAKGDPDCEDILDGLAELVLRRKGNVFVLPKDMMPDSTGAMAIYRYN